MTVKELREGIRRLTQSVNAKIAEYRERNLTNRFFDKQVNRLKASTSYVNRKTGEVRIPKSRTGELGLGFTGKSKSDLERQYRELESFDTKEWRSRAAEQVRAEEKSKSYQTFVRRYGYVTVDEWIDLVLMTEDIKNYLVDFGYEDIGPSIANNYAESRDKGNFLHHIKETMGRVSGKGATPEDFIDVLTEVLIEEGAIDE